MTTQHTPEPWVVTVAGDGAIFLSGGNAEHITDIGGSNEDAAMPDARRIVACVNACAGLSNEALEIIAAVRRDV